MFKLRTIRSRVLFCGALVAILAGLIVTALHTRAVRLYVLIRIQALLEHRQKLVLEATDLDYNVLLSHYELKNVVLRGADAASFPAAIQAKQVAITIPIWDLVRGTFDAAQIRMDGVSVRLEAHSGGRGNLPVRSSSNPCPQPKGPAVAVTNAEIVVDQGPNGISVEVPKTSVSAVWDASAGTYRIALDASGGRLQWKNLRLPLDSVRLRSNITGCTFSIESLLAQTGDSRVETRGTLDGSSSSIEATTQIDIDSSYLRPAMPTKMQPTGRLQGEIRVAGPLHGFNVAGKMRLSQIRVGKVIVQHPALDAILDTSDGQLRIGAISAEIMAGEVRGTGTLWTGAKPDRSQLDLKLTGANPRQVGQALGLRELRSTPLSLQLTASCLGLNWRHGTAYGTIRSAPVEIGFNAALDQTRLHAVFDSSVQDSARMHGDVVIDLPDQSLSGSLDGTVSSLAQLGHHFEHILNHSASTVSRAGLDGSAHWKSVLSGTLDAPGASLHIRADEVRLYGWEGIQLDVDANYSPPGIEISRAKGLWHGQQVTAKGEIDGVSADSRLKLQASLTSSSVTPLLHQLGVAVPVEGGMSSDIHIAGTVGHPSAEGTLHANRVTISGDTLSNVAAGVRWRDDTLTLTRLTARQDHGFAEPGEIEMSGSLELASGRFAANLEAKNLYPPEPRPGKFAITGIFDITAKADGALSDVNLRSEIVGRNIFAGDVPLGNLTVRLDASAHRANLRLDMPQLNTELTATAAMSGAWPFEVSLNSKGTQLATTPAAMFDATVIGSGSLTQLEASRLTASIHNLRLAMPVQDVTSDGPVELSYEIGRIRVDRMALSAGDSTLQLNGEIPVKDDSQPGSMNVSGALDLRSLPQFLPTLRTAQLTGLAELSATLHGTVSNLQPDGSITIRDGTYRSEKLPFAIEGIDGKLTISQDLLRVDNLSFNTGSGTFRAEGSLPLHLLSPMLFAPVSGVGQEARFTAKAENVQISAGTGKNRSTTVLSLTAEGEASALSLAALRGTVDFDELVIKTGERDLRQSAPTRITIADRLVRLERLELTGPNGSLKASGSIGLTGAFPLQADLAGSGDLIALSPFLAPVETTGNLRLDLHVKGTLSDPLATGYVELDQATLSIPHPLLQAENVRVRADFEQDRVSLRELSARLNGGSVSGGGYFNLNGGRIHTADVFLKGDDIFAEIPQGLKTINSLDVKVVSQGDRLVLEGQIYVQDGVFEATLDLLSGSSNRFADTNLKIESKANALQAVGLHLKVITKRPVEMNNNLGRISGTGDLLVTGTLDHIRLLGSMELEQDGKIYFGDRIYYIERGTVRFLDAPKVTPDLNILTYTRTNAYTIRLGLTGTPGDITTTFTSDPPLSREDVISVLLTGKTVAENRGADVRSLEAFSVAAGAMSAALSSQLHGYGVSRVSIQPSAVAAESNPGTRVTVTHDFSQAFRIMYSTNLTDSGDQIWVGEYDLTRAFTTRLVKQSDNTYRGEFRHDVQFGAASNFQPSTLVGTRKPKVNSVTFTGESTFGEDVLAKKFKVKVGKNYDAIKIRKGAERLNKFFVKKGYLESRVHLDREESEDGMDLTVRIELGPSVEMTFQGAKLPRSQRARLRNVWHAGMSDRQRPVAAKNAILDYFAGKGHLRAQADAEVAEKADHKMVQFHLTPGIQYRDVKVEISGAAPEHIKDIRSLIRADHLEVGSDRDPTKLMNAITLYYQARGYLVVKVDPPVFDLNDQVGKARIVVPIKEGPVFRVGAVEFSGNHALSGNVLSDGLPIETGQVFEPTRLEPAMMAIRLKYGNLGYRSARVDYVLARQAEGSSVDVRFTVVENKQTSIRFLQIVGNRKTSTKFARRRLLISEGQVADPTKIRDSVTNLSRTGAYAAANIEVKAAPENTESQTPSQVSVTDTNAESADLILKLVEPRPFRLLYGGLYDNGSGPGFIFDLQNRNSVGPGRTLGFRTRYDSETKEARVYLTQPYWGLKRVSTTVSSYFTNMVAYGQDYPTAKVGIGFEQDWPSRGKFLLSYGVRFEKQRAWLPVNGKEVPTPIVFAAPLTITISREARDSFLDATRGSFTSHSFEFAPQALGTEFPYIRYYLQYLKYFPLTRARPVPYGETPNRSRFVFATGTRIGLQKGLNPQNVVLTDRFYAGGGTTVRGFQQDSLGPKLPNGAPIGGNAVVILNNELRYPLFWVFDAVNFVDIGNVFPQVSDFRFGDLRKTSGFGLRIRNPFVVLRFDYGFKLDRRPGESSGAFFFSIGQAF